MPRPPRRVPSKRTSVSKGRVAKASRSETSRKPTSKGRLSTDKSRPVRNRSIELGEEPNIAAAPREPKRRVSGGVNKSSSSMPILVPRKKKILLEDLEKKWVQLSDTSVSDLSKIMRDVGRSVLLELPLKSAAKRDEAQRTLDKSYKKFERSLTRFKIPPGTSEKIFNNEYLINEEARLNALIEPEARQINMLQKEIAKQRRLLEKEEAQLNTLKKNANAEKEVRRQKAQKFIPSLKSSTVDPDQLQLEIDKIRLDTTEPSEFMIAQDLHEDEQLGPTIHQLEKSLNSLSRNRQALGIIPEWMQSARAAVDDVLYKTNRYSDVMDWST